MVRLRYNVARRCPRAASTTPPGPVTSAEIHSAFAKTRSRNSRASTALTLSSPFAAIRSSVTTCIRGIRTSRSVEGK